MVVGELRLHCISSTVLQNWMVSHLNNTNICSKRKSCNWTLSSWYEQCKIHFSLCLCMLGCQVGEHYTTLKLIKCKSKLRKLGDSYIYKLQNTVDSLNLLVLLVTNLKQLPVKINYKRHLYSFKTTFYWWISNQQNNHKSPKYISLNCDNSVTTLSQHCDNSVTTLRQQCHNIATTVSQLKICDFSGETFKGLKCYNFLRVQQRHNCSPAASFANCVTTLYLLKVHLQTFLAIPITQKCQILSCDTLVANEQYINNTLHTPYVFWHGFAIFGVFNYIGASKSFTL